MTEQIIDATTSRRFEGRNSIVDVTSDANYPVARQWTVAQSWWIASELCRRNAALRVDQDASHGHIRIRVRRDLARDAGGADHVTFHPVLGIEGVGDTQWLSWAAVFAEDDSHTLVKQIEHKLAWTQATRSPTIRRSLAYRTIARVLSDTVNDKERPEVLSWNSMFGATPHDTAWLSNFDGLTSLLTKPGGTQDPPLWVLFRGGPEGILVISESGTAYRRDGSEPVDLMKRYVLRHRIEDVVTSLLPH